MRDRAQAEGRPLIRRHARPHDVDLETVPREDLAEEVRYLRALVSRAAPYVASLPEPLATAWAAEVEAAGRENGWLEQP